MKEDENEAYEQMALLSAGEKEVLKLLAYRKSTKEIAKAMMLVPETVESHYRNIKVKLGLTTKIDLVKYAIDNVLI